MHFVGRIAVTLLFYPQLLYIVKVRTNFLCQTVFGEL